MDKVQVQLLKSKIAQSLINRIADHRWGVESVPQLRRDPNLIAGNLLERLSNFLFVFIDVGTVKMAVAKGKGFLDNRLDDIGFRAPYFIA